MTIEVDVGTLPLLTERIAEIRARLQKLTPILDRQALLLASLIDDSFQNSRSPLGEPWSPLADSTVEKRRKGSSKPLVDTTQLRQASFARTKGQSIVFGTSGAPANYGLYHIRGTKNENGGERMKRRAYLPLDNQREPKPDFSSGPAAAWLAQTEERVVNFILHDER